VWKILRSIPYGEVITYGGIARQMALRTGKTSMSAQAVGGAVGHNPISIIIPCHRVVGASGSLTGYAGGIGTKVKLLELESADMSRLFVPKRGTAL
jgi:methylated-DNA-[protein]-cysteine S-methyltransferase